MASKILFKIFPAVTLMPARGSLGMSMMNEFLQILPKI